MTAAPTQRAAQFDDAICVQNPVRCRRTDLAGLSEWLRSLVGTLAPDRPSFTLRLVGDPEMRRLNSTYRGQDKSTDVLSFPGQEDSPSPYLGDVAIAVPTARRQAATCGHALPRELRILALHGVLHCLGYDHEVDDGRMARREQALRERWIPDHE